MLILTRRTNELIRIGDEVAITVLSIRGNQVQIGIDAPRSAAVHREEIYTRIETHRERAAREGVAPEGEISPIRLRLVSTTGEVRQQQHDPDDSR